MTFDVTDARAVTDAVGDLARRSGAPAAVVANAGVQGDFAPVQDHDVDVLRGVLEVNVVGVFNTVQATARSMIDAGVGGSIVITASMAGVNGAPNMPGLRGVQGGGHRPRPRAPSLDLAPHAIRVNAVSPGFIGPGAMWDNQIERQAAARSQYYATDPAAVARQMIDLVPMRRYGTPSEVADVVCFLAGDRSSYLTGLNIEISGGAA